MTEEKVVAKNKDHLKKLIKAAIKENGVNCNLNFIDVSQVTDMSRLFEKSTFNGDTDDWLPVGSHAEAHHSLLVGDGEKGVVHLAGSY